MPYSISYCIGRIPCMLRPMRTGHVPPAHPRVDLVVRERPDRIGLGFISERAPWQAPSLVSRLLENKGTAEFALQATLGAEPRPSPRKQYKARSDGCFGQYFATR